MPPKLRGLYDSARKLAHIRAQKILWANTLKALEPSPKPVAKKPKGKKK